MMGIQEVFENITLHVKYNFQDIELTCEYQDVNENHKHSNDSLSFSKLQNMILNPCETELDVRRITVLNLSGCKIRSLPDCCAKLNLKQLNLSNNNLEEVPECLYTSLPKLEFLDVSYNSITSFYREPNCVNYLKYLNLSHAKFTTIPEWIQLFKCINLLEFNYSMNKILNLKCISPQSFDYNLNVAKIKTLKLLNSCLQDGDISFFVNLRTLEHLDLSNNGRTNANVFLEVDVIFTNQKWRALNILALNNLSISKFPERILCLLSLKELYLSQNVISWLPEEISELKKLEVLDLSKNSISVLSEEINCLECLRVLNVSYNNVLSLPNLLGCNKLEVLDLYNNNLDSFSEINLKLPSLKSMDIERNYLDSENCPELGEEYLFKKSILRSHLNDNRFDGPKYHSPVNINTEEDEYYDDEEFLESSRSGTPGSLKLEKFIQFEDEEDWDAPVRVSIDSDISPSDDEWDGIEKCVQKKIRKQYIDYDDWMFCDID